MLLYVGYECWYSEVLMAMVEICVAGVSAHPICLLIENICFQIEVMYMEVCMKATKKIDRKFRRLCPLVFVP